MNTNTNTNPNADLAPFLADINKILAANSTGTSPNMGPGKWLVSLEKPFIKQSESGPKRFFIVPFTVIACTGEAKRGDRVAWKPDITSQSGPANVKQFILAVGQSLWDAETFSEEASKGLMGMELMSAILHGEYVEGMLMMADAFEKKTRAGGDFTVVTWFPFDGETAKSWFGEVEIPEQAAPSQE